MDKPEIHVVESIEFMNNLGDSDHLALDVTLNVNPNWNISATNMVSDKKIFKVFILKIYFSLCDLDMQQTQTVFEQKLKRVI